MASQNVLMSKFPVLAGSRGCTEVYVLASEVRNSSFHQVQFTPTAWQIPYLWELEVAKNATYTSATARDSAITESE